MPLKRINLPSSLNFPVKIVQVHVKAGEQVTKGDPVYTLHTNDGKRGILRAPFSGVITEGPMAVDAEFSVASPVIAIITDNPESPPQTEASASDQPEPQRSEPDKEPENTAPNPMPSQQPTDNSAPFPFVGILAIILLVVLAFFLPGLLFHLFGPNPAMEPEFLIYATGTALGLAVLTTLVGLSGVFKNRILLPVLGILAVYLSAYAAGYFSNEIRGIQNSALNPIVEFAENKLVLPGAPKKDIGEEVKQVVQLPKYDGTDQLISSEPFYGEIRAFAFNFCPRGWTKADGQLIKISLNSALFSLFGTYYGGDGRTTFGIPDMRGRHVVGTGKGPLFGDLGPGTRFGSDTIDLREGGNRAAAIGDPDLALNFCVSLNGLYPSRN